MCCIHYIDCPTDKDREQLLINSLAHPSTFKCVQVLLAWNHFTIANTSVIHCNQLLFWWLTAIIAFQPYLKPHLTTCPELLAHWKLRRLYPEGTVSAFLLLMLNCCGSVNPMPRNILWFSNGNRLSSGLQSLCEDMHVQNKWEVWTKESFLMLHLQVN